MQNSLLIIPFIFFLFYFLLKNNNFIINLIDNDFNKPQSFHTTPTPRLGGFLIIITFLIIYLIQGHNFENSNYIIIFLLTNFFLGFFDDTKLIVNPIKRFLLFLLLNIILIYIFNIKIIDFDNNILNFLNNHSIYSASVLVLFSIFFCVNGSNLIDGFNGLLAIHSLIIICFLLFNFGYDIKSDLNFFLIAFAFILFCFLILNFPYSKIFLGDSGSFVIGTFLALAVITTSNKYDQISSYYFAILIYYIFFEIFFSVFRKVFQKKNPFKPDGEHLHMLLFNFLYQKNKRYLFCNYFTSIIINLIYLLSILPLIWIKNNYLMCEIYFFSLILFYLINYYVLKKLNEKKN